MPDYNPYFVDEIVAGLSPREDYFGLIRDEDDKWIELCGYEITLDGRVVVPRLNPENSQESIEIC